MHSMEQFDEKLIPPALMSLKHQSSLLVPPTQHIEPLRVSSQSWSGPPSREGVKREQTDRYHGALNLRSKRPWLLRQARDAELRKIHEFYQWWQSHEAAGTERPPYILAFVNSDSGNQHASRAIKQQLLTILGVDFQDSSGTNRYLAGAVCELSEVEHNPLHVRDCIIEAKQNERAGIYSRGLRFLVCGCDATVTWVLHELEACKQMSPELFPEGEMEPPMGIVPGGVANDLARSLGWGARLSKVRDLVEYVHWTLEGRPVALDQWEVRLRLKDVDVRNSLPPAFETITALDKIGYFHSYFSVGMDARIAYKEDRVRNSCWGRLLHRLVGGRSCDCCQNSRLRCCYCCARHLSLVNDQVLALQDLSNSYAPVHLGRVRQLTLTNLNSYASGRVIFSLEDLPTVRPADGKLEFFSLSRGCALASIMAGGTQRNIEKAKKIRFELQRGEYFQMDSEAWRLDVGAVVEISLDRHVQMLRPPTCRRGIWSGRQFAGFWGPAS